MANSESENNFQKEFEAKFAPYSDEKKEVLLFYAVADGFESIDRWLDWKKANWILKKMSERK